MPRDTLTFAGTFLEVTSHMSAPPPSEVVEKIVELANRNPHSYVAIAPTGDFTIIPCEWMDIPDAKKAPDGSASVDDLEMLVHPFEGGAPNGYDWVIGPNGLRDGIWPQPLTETMIAAYKNYSLFGLGDEYDQGI